MSLVKGLTVLDRSLTASCDACNGMLKLRYSAVVDPQTLETFGISVCEACGLGHTIPPPQDLQRYYGSTYHGGRHGLTAKYRARRRLRLLKNIMGTGGGHRLLDVGCGDGTLLLLAKRFGWEVCGTELNPSIARASGLDVRGSLTQFEKGETFDCITLWHSLEHMANPRATLEQIAGLLSPGGNLVVAVPNAEGLQARFFGPFWFHLDVPRHLYHFGNRSLTYLLEGSGFTILRRWHLEFEYDLFGWAQSALNTILPIPNLFFNTLTGRPVTVGKISRLASGMLGGFVGGLALPLVPMGALSGSGGTLIVVCGRQDQP